MRELERRVLLSVLDRKWREHLYEMDYLREGIGLRAYSQRDPLVEYQREGFDMFAAMMDGIKEESVGYLFNLEVQVEEEPDEADAQDEVEVGPALAQAAAARPRTSPPGVWTRRSGRRDWPTRPRRRRATPRSAGSRGRGGGPLPGASRNAECPCGSGKKYKKCHGAPGGPTGLTTRAADPGCSTVLPVARPSRTAPLG